VGHAVIQVEEVREEKEAYLRTDGLIKCSFVPPERLYNNLLPFRCNNKLMFSLRQ